MTQNKPINPTHSQGLDMGEGQTESKRPENRGLRVRVGFLGRGSQTQFRHKNAHTKYFTGMNCDVYNWSLRWLPPPIIRPGYATKRGPKFPASSSRNSGKWKKTTSPFWFRTKCEITRQSSGSQTAISHTRMLQ